MEIIQIFCHNSLRNFIYILVDKKTNEAFCIDPFDAHIVNDVLKQRKLKLTKIFNTHEHWDHIQGNQELMQKHNCKLISVPGVDSANTILKGGETFQLSDTKIEIVKTSGHTENHICLLTKSPTKQTIFSGDMLFNAGVGNCKSGGNVNQMFDSIKDFFMNLDKNTLLYPGHDYFLNNLEFYLHYDPSNKKIKIQIELVKTQKEKGKHLTTNLALEREINPFLRFNDKEIKKRIGLDKESDARSTFKSLRKLRDNW